MPCLTDTTPVHAARQPRAPGAPVPQARQDALTSRSLAARPVDLLLQKSPCLSRRTRPAGPPLALADALGIALQAQPAVWPYRAGERGTCAGIREGQPEAGASRRRD